MLARCVEEATAQDTGFAQPMEPFHHAGQRRDVAFCHQLTIESFLPVRQASDLRRLGRPTVDFLDNPRALHAEAANEAIRSDRASRARPPTFSSSARAACPGIDNDPVPVKMAPNGASARELTRVVALPGVRNFSAVRPPRPRPGSHRARVAWGHRPSR